ncbi:MAG: saccharopine dehydrogenase family protein [Opitutales bacterium]
MSKVLIVGAGGVGNVVAQKCARLPQTFSEIVLASRTVSKCQAIAERCARPVKCVALDADDVAATTRLLQAERPKLLINVALPYQDLPLMDACLCCGVDYLDTANYEPPDTAKFEYSWQWAYRDRYRQAGLMALLGAGFDPGVTNVFCAWLQKHHFDEIHTVDILDANGGDHGKPFATNFNPETNIREITQRGRYWEDGQWIETDALSQAHLFDFPEIGPRKAYLMYHEELESLVLNLRGLRRIRFWMTFSDSYLSHLRVLENVGLTRIDPVLYEGQPIVPLRFLKALLPDPASLAAGYTGKTNIGVIATGTKDGQKRTRYLYNICDHEQTYREVGAQAINYTTGVPAVVASKLMLDGAWRQSGVFNIEELDPDPFMEAIGPTGLPWTLTEVPEAFWADGTNVALPK